MIFKSKKRLINFGLGLGTVATATLPPMILIACGSGNNPQITRTTEGIKEPTFDVEKYLNQNLEELKVVLEKFIVTISNQIKNKVLTNAPLFFNYLFDISNMSKYINSKFVVDKWLAPWVTRFVDNLVEKIVDSMTFSLSQVMQFLNVNINYLANHQSTKMILDFVKEIDIEIKAINEQNVEQKINFILQKIHQLINNFAQEFNINPKLFNHFLEVFKEISLFNELQKDLTNQHLENLTKLTEELKQLQSSIPTFSQTTQDLIVKFEQTVNQLNQEFTQDLQKIQQKYSTSLHDILNLPIVKNVISDPTIFTFEITNDTQVKDVLGNLKLLILKTDDQDLLTNLNNMLTMIEDYYRNYSSLKTTYEERIDHEKNKLDNEKLTIAEKEKVAQARITTIQELIQNTQRSTINRNALVMFWISSLNLNNISTQFAKYLLYWGYEFFQLFIQSWNDNQDVIFSSLVKDILVSLSSIFDNLVQINNGKAQDLIDKLWITIFPPELITEFWDSDFVKVIDTPFLRETLTKKAIELTATITNYIKQIDNNLQTNIINNWQVIVNNLVAYFVTKKSLDWEAIKKELIHAVEKIVTGIMHK